MASFKDLFSRPVSILHPNDKAEYKEEINSMGSTKDVREFQYLFSDCFNHHAEMHSSANDSSLEVIKGDPHRVISSDNLTSYFLENLYVIPKVHMTDSHDETEKNNNEVSFDDFVEMVTANPITTSDKATHDLGKNRRSYLIGNIGEGKTTLIAKLLKEIKKTEFQEKNGSLIPIYITADEYILSNNRLKEIDTEFYSDLYQKTYNEICLNPNFAELSDINDFCPNPNNQDPIFRIKRLAKHLADRGVRLLFILDNLDRYHFYFSRYSFFKEYSQEQSESIKRNLGGLINTFSSRSELGSTGLCVLIVCRKYVYQHFRFSTNAITPDEDFSSVFQLPPAAVQSVVSSRVELLAKSIAQIEKSKPQKGSDWKDALVHLEDILRLEGLEQKYKGWGTDKFSESALEAISQLSHHGHRTFVSFLSSLKLNYKEVGIFERLISKQTIILLIIYINNLRKRYTQKNDHIPNMYLNDCVILDNPEFPNAHQPHQHTYWLKYLILKYMVHKESESTTFGEIYELFHVKGGFEDHLVRHVIGSLCTSNEFRCAEVDYSLGENNFMQRSIIPTDRGRYLVNFDSKLFPRHKHEVDFCFSFIYLQLVIDDQILSVPTNFYSKIFTNKNYSYLYMDETNYGKLAGEMVKTKSAAVLYFLRVLTASFNVENERRKELFDYLEKENILPNIDHVAASIKEEIRQLCFKLKLEDHYPKIEKLWKELTSDNEYENFFREHYKSGDKIS